MNFRFPYLCFKNGGGAFLIPYFILIITGAVPMYFLEVIMGQYTRSGAIKIWDICPIFRWVWLIKFTPYLHKQSSCYSLDYMLYGPITNGGVTARTNAAVH